MPLEKHHKILIWSSSTLATIFMVTVSIFLYLLYVRVNVNNEMLDDKITQTQKEADSKISELTSSIRQTNNLIESKFGSIDKELNLIKATASEDFSGIIDDSIKSVVTIKTSAGFQGTGFIISDEGYIVTNAHVLADSQGNLADVIQIIDSDQNSEDAEFIGYNGTIDIALLKVSGNYDALEIGDSNDVNVGEKVIAIGNPLGLQFSVSEGIISAVHREGGNGLDVYIQTDTALNPGNSGGPLINKQGVVIGINNFKIGSGENLGFALESNEIIKSVNEISMRKLNLTLIE